ncbi:MAG TPA: amidase family protein [Thermomicrobiaceae bacterium]|nr:amidase family protein [Thermomicrobiaceae bacterium]
MSELWDLTAAEIVAGIRGRELTASDLVAALLDRAAEVEPEVLAWATLDAQGAAAEARVRDDRVAEGVIGPLQGVPVGIKDIIDVAGLPTIAGFEPFRDRVAERDAEIVARLRTAGAIILGKTHTTQFAHGDPAPTRNPWNAERTPGGSSSGSAAAVAARMVPLAVGTQTAGSVLRPAAYCGVVGFKPSFNWVDRAGVLPLAWSLDHVGLFARTVADVALVFGAVSGTSLDLDADGPAAPRIVLLPEFLERAEPPVRDHLLDVATRLREAGASVEERSLPVDLDVLLAVHHVIMASEVSAVHAEALAADPASYGPVIRLTIETGQLIPAAYLLKAQRLRRQIARAIDEALAGIDGFLLPTASNPAPPRRSTGDRAFQAPWTLVGAPSITLPTGLTEDGLPIGSQLVGRRGGDARLLALAAWSARKLGLIAAPEIRLPEPEPIAEPEPLPEEPEAVGAGELPTSEPVPAAGESEASEQPVEPTAPESDLPASAEEPVERPVEPAEPTEASSGRATAADTAVEPFHTESPAGGAIESRSDVPKPGTDLADAAGEADQPTAPPHPERGEPPEGA